MKRLKYTLLGAVLVAVPFISLSFANPDFGLGKNMDIFFNLFRDVNLFYVDSVNSDKMMKDAADAMLGKLDPYTEYIPASEVDDFKAMTTGKYGGVGSLVRQKGDYVELSEPYKGFPADKAGLRAGDLIVGIDGQSIKGKSVTDVSNMMKGTPGTSFSMTVKKLRGGQEETIKLTRERITISDVPYAGMLKDGVGYIRLDGFTEGCADQVRRAFTQLKSEGMTSMIIDLRSNGGGLLNEAISLVGLFVPKGSLVVSTKGKVKDMDAVYKTASSPIDTEIPIAVLVSSSSASASEIVAGAFQDMDRAVVVGQRTFGKGLVQSTRPLGYNAMLKVTTAKYYTPSGRCVQALDYTHRNEDGSVGKVPDSLITEFKSLAGRKVYDGGGVMPDTKLEPEYLSQFTSILLAYGYIDDFANLYYKDNTAVPDILKFKVDDKTYADFTEFMKDKTLDYESSTQRALETLKTNAKREKYLDRIEPQIKAMEEEIKEDRGKDLALFKSEIADVLAATIINKYHYAEGRIRSTLDSDKGIAAAEKILTDPAEYKEILTSRNTAKE